MSSPDADQHEINPVVPLLMGAGWHGDHPGGLHRYHAELFASLRKVGLRPRAAVIGPASSAPVGVVAGGLADQWLPLRLCEFALATARAGRSGVTLVDSHFSLYAFIPLMLGRLRRLPLVVHFQGPWADESVVAGERSGWRIRVKRTVERSTYRKAQTLVTLSTAFKQVLVERYGIPPWRIEVIPPGIDLAKFVPADRPDARKSLDLPGDAVVALTVRRLVPRTGVDVLLDAWGGIAPDMQNAVLLVVGNGPERARLVTRATQRGFGASVRFLGSVDENTLVRCYQAADLSVVPTVALEGYGLVVLESLACGTPVVVTDSGGLPETVAELDPSLVVPAGDSDALAARLRAGLTDPASLPDRFRCRLHAEGFGWPRIAERHKAMYTRAVSPGPRKLRVVYLDHCARLSGGELALLHLLPALDVDAHVILGEPGPLVEELRAAGISVEVVPIEAATGTLGREKVRPGRLPLLALAHTAAHVAELALRLRRLRPDLVHTNSLKSALYGGAAARLASVPVVWHVRDRISGDYLPAAAARIVRASARVLPAAIIANSEATLTTLGRASAGGVSIASPLGFAPSQTPRAPTNRPLRVGIVGRLDPWKGQHVFLDAFAKAFPSGPEEAVIIGASLFGTHGYATDLERQAAALGLTGRVDFRGFRDDVENELGRLDVLVHASTIPEPFGQVVVEGMAVGLPVLAANAGGPAEVIEHGVTGLLYPPGDVDALALALQRVATDPALRRRLGDSGRRRAEDFTADRIAEQVMAVYEGVLRRLPSSRVPA